jgi:predicted GNAT superfamily acetyltransferase
MLAVRMGGRDRGLGTRLKLYQREVVLGRGVKEMRWTFDPLQSRNANVNFSKLGILCREYVENMYGITDSPLHWGIGTDRLVAVWDLDSDRVRSRLGGEDPPTVDAFPEAPRVLSLREHGPFPSPSLSALELTDPQVLLPVPAAIDAIMAEDMGLAIRWREATREAFLHYFSRGYEAREFLRGDHVSFYLLRRP